MLLPLNINFDINGTLSPRSDLIEANIGDFSKKLYYQPESLAKELFSSHNKTENSLSYSCKNQKKTTILDEEGFLDSLKTILEVKEFIKQNTLESPIYDAILKINSAFQGNPYRLDFELTEDVEEQFKTLFIHIHTKLSNRENAKIIRAMFKNWGTIKNPAFHKFVTITAHAE